MIVAILNNERDNIKMLSKLVAEDLSQHSKVGERNSPKIDLFSVSFANELLKAGDSAEISKLSSFLEKFFRDIVLDNPTPDAEVSGQAKNSSNRHRRRKHRSDRHHRHHKRRRAKSGSSRTSRRSKSKRAGRCTTSFPHNNTLVSSTRKQSVGESRQLRSSGESTEKASFFAAMRCDQETLDRFVDDLGTFIAQSCPLFCKIFSVYNATLVSLLQQTQPRLFGTELDDTSTSDSPPSQDSLASSTNINELRETIEMVQQQLTRLIWRYFLLPLIATIIPQSHEFYQSLFLSLMLTRSPRGATHQKRQSTLGVQIPHHKHNQLVEKMQLIIFPILGMSRSNNDHYLRMSLAHKSIHHSAPQEQPTQTLDSSPPAASSSSSVNSIDMIELLVPNGQLSNDPNQVNGGHSMPFLPVIPDQQSRSSTSRDSESDGSRSNLQSIASVSQSLSSIDIHSSTNSSESDDLDTKTTSPSQLNFDQLQDFHQSRRKRKMARSNTERRSSQPSTPENIRSMREPVHESISDSRLLNRKRRFTHNAITPATLDLCKFYRIVTKLPRQKLLSFCTPIHSDLTELIQTLADAILHVKNPLDDNQWRDSSHKNNADRVLAFQLLTARIPHALLMHYFP
eukprot:CAMPEP_0201549772 /NCGR_PEP_ID=MMETSP0173_2-20130828/6220_1 /ASSEMBLY_ACC=CAM_ASM_000268 /TAXON_ID=218659 /ORGANISM="Vexillifera sp., Strain DIVA3 564/2" /LENGTH=623 /DNA_ID=CAMNT_0047959569 /DNA_START=179 /DNA_END=2046 /DNA_ORIENTATION=-